MSLRAGPVSRWVLASVAAFGSLLSGCLACTEIGCVDQLLVVITPSEGERFAARTRWVIETATATRAFSCVVQTDEGGASQIEGGCELPGAFGDPTQLSFFVPLDATVTAAGTVSVRAQASGGTVVDAMDVPFAVESFQPNGPQCPPTCQRAELALVANR